MGTRNLTMVVQDGQFKVAQYGQWDGYPTGQGFTICKFLESANLDSFKEKVKRIGLVDKEAMKEKWDRYKSIFGNEASIIFYKEYPELSRNTAADILMLIATEKVKEVDMDLEFAGDSLMCEWAYLLDLDNDILEIYEGFNKEPVGVDSRFSEFNDKSKTGNETTYYPIALVKKLPFAEVTIKAMEDIERESSEDEED